MRRLRGAGRPRRRAGPDPLGRDQRLPGAGRGVRPAGGRDGGGPGPARGRGSCTRSSARWPTGVARSAATARRASSARWPPSTTARTGGPLPAGRRTDRAAAGAVTATTTGTSTSTGLTVSTCTRSAATCAGAPGTGRSGTRPTPSASPRRTTRSRPGWPSPRRRPRPPRPRTSRAATCGRPSLAEALELLAAEPDAQLVAGSTDWGVELNIRHARAALTIGIERIAELREFSVGPRPHRHRRRAEPVRDRGQAGGPAGCRCWASCSRSSRPG